MEQQIKNQGEEHAREIAVMINWVNTHITRVMMVSIADNSVAPVQHEKGNQPQRISEGNQKRKFLPKRDWTCAINDLSEQKGANQS